MTDEATTEDVSPPIDFNPREPGALAASKRQHRNRELGRKVLRMIQDRGWTPSEFARRAGLNKDVISTTVNGKSYPSHASLKAMARALAVPITDLSVAYEDGTMSDASIEMGAQAVAGQPGRMRLTINKIVPTAVALEVLNLVGAVDADAADRS